MIHSVQEIPEIIFRGLVRRLQVDVLQLNFGKNQIYQIFWRRVTGLQILVGQTTILCKEGIFAELLVCNVDFKGDVLDADTFIDPFNDPDLRIVAGPFLTEDGQDLLPVDDVRAFYNNSLSGNGFSLNSPFFNFMNRVALSAYKLKKDLAIREIFKKRF